MTREPPDLSTEFLAGRRRIRIPARANVAADTLGLHVPGPRAGATALIEEAADGTVRHFSFAEFDSLVRRLAAVLRGRGVGRGSVVVARGVPSAAVLAAHLAAHRLGAVLAALPRSWEAEATARLLAETAATVLVTQPGAWAPPPGAGAPLVLRVEGPLGPGESGWEAVLAAAPDPGPPADTGPEDPALLVQFPGPGGGWEGVLHGHRLLHACRPTVEMLYDLELHASGAVMWSGADWGRVSPFASSVYPALQYGHAQVVSAAPTDGAGALALVARHGVTHLHAPAELLEAMAEAAPDGYPGAAPRVVVAGGPSLSEAARRWAGEVLGASLNRGYGTAVAVHLAGECRALRPPRPGAMGREFPGHVVALVDLAGEPVLEGQVGEIVTVPGSPTLCLGLWREGRLRPVRRLGPWVRTGDLASRDEEGNLHHRGRVEQAVEGPRGWIPAASVEAALADHPAVAAVRVCARGADRARHLRAWIRLVAGGEAGPATTSALRAHALARAAAAPSEILFED